MASSTACNCFKSSSLRELVPGDGTGLPPSPPDNGDADDMDLATLGDCEISSSANSSSMFSLILPLNAF